MLRKIRTDQLVLGMHVKEFCGSWLDHPFWRTDFVIKTEKELNTVRVSKIKEVWIDSDKGLDLVEEPVSPVRDKAAQPVAATARAEVKPAEVKPTEVKSAEVKLEPQPAVPASRPEAPRPTTQAVLRPPAVTMEVEVERATKICAQAKHAVTSMFQEARMGKAVDEGGAKQLVEEISDSVARNPRGV